MMGALAYDAMKLTADALRRAKSLDSASLMQALEETEDFPGVTGKISLKGRNGNPSKRLLVVEIRPEGQVYRKEYTYEEIKEALQIK
jgi:branched-chain amino acid transport system substrate-binding protein